ncbi:MAG: hypothetical protein AAF762_04890 [Pseudomonadota bacterium]
MDVSKALDDMRSEVAGCDLVAFADLSSQMVLCTSSATKRAQEEIDALTGAASLTLEGAVADGAGALTGGAPATAVTMTQADLHVFLRNPAAANEALICVCAPDADVSKIVDCGRATLDRIVAQG